LIGIKITDLKLNNKCNGRYFALVNRIRQFTGAYGSLRNVVAQANKAATAKEQDAQVSQRDCDAGCVSFGQKWKTGTGRQYFTDIIGISSTTVTWSSCKAIKFGEKNTR